MPGGLVLLGGQQVPELRREIPELAVIAKDVLEAAPADVFDQDLLLVRRGLAVLGLDRLESLDRQDVGRGLGYWGAVAGALRAGGTKCSARGRADD